MPQDRVPPQNLEAEEYVLGAMMLSPGAVATCLEALRSADFYRGSHGVIFEAIARLEAENEPADAITVADKLEAMGKLKEVGGKSRIHELALLVPASANAAHYAKIVRKQAQLRALVEVGHHILEDAYESGQTPEEIIARAESLLTRPDLASGKSARLSLVDFFAQIAEQSEAGIDPGIDLGLEALDDLIGGLEPGNLMYLAARPSMGKSALAVGFAYHVAYRGGVPVQFVSIEMSERETIQRFLSSIAHVNIKRIRRPRLLSQDDWARLNHAADRLSKLPLDIECSITSMADLRSFLKRQKRVKFPNLGLVVVDYLQLIASPGSKAENQNVRVSEISRALKLLAKELEVPIICLSQLSRAVEMRTNKRPQLSDLRDSGSLEQDADLALFIYRDDYYHPDSDQQGIAELILAKHRNGPTGTAKVQWHKEYARFSNLQLVSDAQSEAA